jgi:hypothetical protein
MRLCLHLFVAVISFSQCALTLPEITADKAIGIGRKACEKFEKALIPKYGDYFPTHRKDWSASLKDDEWTVSAHVHGFYFMATVPLAGGETKCMHGMIDG